MRYAVVVTSEREFAVRQEGDILVPIADAQTGGGADPLITLIEGGIDPATAAPIADELAPERVVRYRAPVRRPTKVICVGLNYLDHVEETGLGTTAPNPTIFFKAANSIAAPNDPIEFRSSISEQIDSEGELAVVIGRSAKSVSRSSAQDYILGFSVCNDIAARDLQFADSQWTRGKCFDGFLPLGPTILDARSAPNLDALRISTTINGSKTQDDSIGSMRMSVEELIEYITRTMTLEPGDVIATGTPAGVGYTRNPPQWLRDGDLVQVEISGIGVLANSVRNLDLQLGASPRLSTTG